MEVILVENQNKNWREMSQEEHLAVQDEVLLKQAIDQEELMEAILLQVPDFVECHDGDCPERKNISKFLKKDGAGKNEYQPFKDLHLD